MEIMISSCRRKDAMIFMTYGITDIIGPYKVTPFNNLSQFFLLAANLIEEVVALCFSFLPGYQHPAPSLTHH
jgi:uncharacterized membrane protein YukC